MTYATIQPPFTLKFREMSKKELKDYFEWFLGMIPQRIIGLAAAVGETPGFETWQPDCTPASLDVLGEWFSAQVETRNRSQEELQEIKDRLVFPMEIPNEELTNRTFSLAMDIGMYISKVFLKNHPTLKWNQSFGNKKHVDYGQPVLVEFGAMAFNPVHMMVTHSYALAKKSRTGRGLREIYDYWSKQVQ